MLLGRALDFRQTVVVVIALNLFYFVIQSVIALLIGSVSLAADAADYLEDSSINFLILAALVWPRLNRPALGKFMAAIILFPSLAALWMAWRKYQEPVEPDALVLVMTGFGALAVNVTCAFLLTRFKDHSGSLTKAAFLSARNDAVAALGIIIGGVLTAVTLSPWPDVVIGLFIVALNAGAAFEVYEEATRETA